MQLRDSDKLLREHAQNRIKLREDLQASKLLQTAKLQARLDQYQERLVQGQERNKRLYNKRKEMEKKILE